MIAQNTFVSILNLFFIDLFFYYGKDETNKLTIIGSNVSVAINFNKRILQVYQEEYNDKTQEERFLKDHELLEQVKEITQGMEKKWCNHSDGCEGSGFVEDSVFFVRPNLILWIVVLCDDKVAFIEFSPDTLANFSEVIMESPRIFVKFNKCHKIEDFFAFQKKKCHECPPKDHDDKCHKCH